MVVFGGLAAVFLVTLLLLNLVLHFMIIRPIRRMSAIASEVSLGNNDAPEFAEQGQRRDRVAGAIVQPHAPQPDQRHADAGAPEPSPRPPPLPSHIGRYRVERELGRGAMGVIYQADDPDIGRTVAIKLVRADLLDGDDREQFLARFRHEARAAGRCAHPNIVALYDFAMHEGNPFLAMEFVDGVGLGQALKQAGRFAPAEAVAIITQVLDALGAAHALGIVHRDVKPANILLLPNGQVKVTDFGISRLDTSHITQDGAIIGTPAYMSPEQCRGDDVDARSDLFSVGSVLYELLTGSRAFSGRNVTEVT